MAMRPRPSVLNILVILLLASPLCAAGLNFAPIVKYERDETGTSVSALGPLFEKTPEYTALRPLWFHEEGRTDFLYPLGTVRDDHERFTPFYSRQIDEQHPRWLCFPCFGGTWKGERYGGMFPFYGHVEQRFGVDDGRFVLWPVYTRTTEDDRDTWRILWPIFTYSPGHVWKVFPLYGREQEDDELKEYALWPLIHHHRTPERSFDAFLPFFAWDRGPEHRSISVLWPLFTVNDNYRAGHHSVDMPWPFVRYATGAYEELRVFPFYWHKEKPVAAFGGDAMERTGILWPCYSERITRYPREGLTLRQRRILILSGTRERYDHGELVRRELSAWPLWYQLNDAGNVSWRFPNLVPLNERGWAHLWTPVLTLASGEEGPDFRTVDLLWHTVTYERHGDHVRLECSFIFSYERHGKQVTVGSLSDLITIPVRP